MDSVSRLNCPEKILSGDFKRILIWLHKNHISILTVFVSYPGKGECAEGGGEAPDRDRKRQLASDTGGGKT
jgi:hypothetical protein